MVDIGQFHGISFVTCSHDVELLLCDMSATDLHLLLSPAVPTPAGHVSLVINTGS